MPLTPDQLVQDKDFMAAPPTEQTKYLSTFDQDFASASPQDQQGYLGFLRQHTPEAKQGRAMAMNPPGVPKPDVNMRENPDAPPPAKVPPSILNAPDWVGDAIGGATIGGTAALAGAPAVGVAAKHPFISSMLIGEARRLPYVGKYIPSYAELGPFLLGEHGAAPKELPEAPKPIEAAPPAEPAPTIAPPTVRRMPGEVAPEAVRPRAHFAGQPPEPIPPRSGLMLPGDVAPEPTPTIAPPNVKGPGQVAPEMIRPRAFRAKTAEPIPPRQGLMLPGETQAPEMPAAPRIATPAEVPVTNAPHTLSGESALRQLLTGQDNKALLQIARSRGVNVTQEAQLKPGVADNKLVGKIIDSFSPEELDEIRSRYIENTRMGRGHLGDIGAEAYKTKSLQTYFPELKIPQSRLNRTAKAVEKARIGTPSAKPAGPPAVGSNEGDLTGVLQESLKAVRKRKLAQ